jgi:hypothetical protein
MQLKIKTPDIELEYTDEYSIIEEAAKKRILEIISQIHTQQVNSKPLPTISAYDVFGELKTNNI